MGKGMYLGVSSKARKVKKLYVGVDGKARKVKKLYVGDANGKARLCWSGHTSKFATTTGKRVYSSENITTWTNTSLSDSIVQDAPYKGIVYGNGMYVVAHLDYSSGCPLAVSYSEDAITWTKVTIDSSIETHYSGIRLFFCNGKFIYIAQRYLYADSYVYTSTKGKTWTKLGITNKPFSDYSLSISTEIVYANVGGSYKYICQVGAGSDTDPALCYSSDLLTWTKSSYMPSGYRCVALHVINDVLYGIMLDTSSYPAIHIRNISTDKEVASTLSGTWYYGYFGGSCVDYDTGQIVFFMANESGYTTDYRYLVSDLKTITDMGQAFAGYTSWASPSYGNGKVVQLVQDGQSSSNYIYARYAAPRINVWTYVTIGNIADTALNKTRMIFSRE